MAEGAVRVRRVRRRHPHGGRAARHRARRRGRGQAAHGAQPQRPGRHRPAALVQARARSRSPVRRGAAAACCSARAEADRTQLLPGYTHLQRAQPVLLAHHLLAHGWALARDVDRLLATVARLDVSPLGAGALAGTSLPIDPAAWPRTLGFAGVRQLARRRRRPRLRRRGAVRLALLGVHLSRIGEELVLWTTEEFGFARLDDAYATGSSMLPQKQNPDIAELARGKAGRLVGDLTGLLAPLKGLPLAYNRDLQEDKEPLFDSIDQVASVLAAIAGMIASATFDTDADGGRSRRRDHRRHRPRRVAHPSRHAVPRAHAIVGELVRRHFESRDATRALVAADSRLGPEAADLVAPGVAVADGPLVGVPGRMRSAWCLANGSCPWLWRSGIRRPAARDRRRPDHLAALHRGLDGGGAGPRPSDRVLEVGAGSGYAAADLVPPVPGGRGPRAHPGALRQARERLLGLGYDNIEIVTTDGTLGWTSGAPFDAILVSAAAGHVPDALIEQLAPGGRLVIPVGPSWTRTCCASPRAPLAISVASHSAASASCRWWAARSWRPYRADDRASIPSSLLVDHVPRTALSVPEW